MEMRASLSFRNSNLRAGIVMLIIKGSEASVFRENLVQLKSEPLRRNHNSRLRHLKPESGVRVLLGPSPATPRLDVFCAT